MYHLLLTRRYLTTKILPFLATLAVMLSTATVIIAWSIMTGFLGVLLNSGRTLVGDVIISWPQAGFGYYEELISDLEKDPAVKAATPVIDVFGLVKLPDNRQRLANVKGIEPGTFGEVAGLGHAIWWKPLDEPLPKDTKRLDPRLVDVAGFVKDELPGAVSSLADAVARLRDTARERKADGQVVAKLDELLKRFEGLVPAGKAAVSLKPNSDERREATAAFLRSAGQAVTDLDSEVNALSSAGTITADDISSRDVKGPPRVLESLRNFDAALLPVYQPYLRLAAAYEDGLTLTARNGPDGERVPGMMLGIEFTDFNERFVEGYYAPKVGVAVRQPNGELRSMTWAVGDPLTLNVLPLDTSPTALDLASRSVPVVNELRTGLFEFDKSWALVDLGMLQKMLRMQAAEEVAPFDPYTVVEGPDGPRFGVPRVVRRSPARVTQVLVRGSGKLELTALRSTCREIYERFEARHAGEVPSSQRIRITTWEEEQATLVGAVKKEIVMVLLILGVVSLTVSFLILSIFWAIVREKTRDIGILRAVGASRLSVCGMWLEYALITGLLGSVLGGLAGCLIVWNINPIHDWMGKHLGLVIWDPKIYYIFEIPNKVDPSRVALVMAAGVCFAVLGALIPAMRAAFMDPVKSLRFE